MRKYKFATEWEKFSQYVIIGGGFAGCALALNILKNLKRDSDSKVVMYEAGEGLFPQASTSANQCWKLHLGLHYVADKTHKTALRCLQGSVTFATEFPECIVGGDNSDEPCRRGRHFVMSGSLCKLGEFNKLAAAIRSEYKKMKNKPFGNVDRLIEEIDLEKCDEISKKPILQPPPKKNSHKAKNDTPLPVAGGGSKSSELDDRTTSTADSGKKGKEGITYQKVVHAFETAESQIDLIKLREEMYKRLVEHTNFKLYRWHAVKRINKIKILGGDEELELIIEDRTKVEREIESINKEVESTIPYLLNLEEERETSGDESSWDEVTTKTIEAIREYVNKFTSHPIYCTKESAVEEIVRLGSEGIAKIRSKIETTIKTARTRVEANCTWEKTEALDPVRSFDPNVVKKIRAKVTAVVRLHKEDRLIHTATVSQGAYCSFTNLWNAKGEAVVAYEPVTNIGDYDPGTNPYSMNNDLGEYLRSSRSPHFEPGKKIADKIMGGAKLYFPFLARATVLKLNLGYVRIQAGPGQGIGIHDPNSAIHKRQGNGISGSVARRVVHADKATTAFHDSREAASRMQGDLRVGNEDHSKTWTGMLIKKMLQLFVMTPYFGGSNEIFVKYAALLTTDVLMLDFRFLYNLIPLLFSFRLFSLFMDGFVLGLHRDIGLTKWFCLCASLSFYGLLWFGAYLYVSECSSRLQEAGPGLTYSACDSLIEFVFVGNFLSFHLRRYIGCRKWISSCSNLLLVGVLFVGSIHGGRGLGQV